MTESLDKTKEYRVLIYDRCPLFAEALSRLMASLNGFVVQCVTGRDEDVMAQLADGGINFIVLDLDAGMSCIKILENIKASWLPVRCVMLISDGSQPALMAAIRMQADGFLSKQLNAEQFAEQMQRVAKGEMVISDSLTSALAVSLRNVRYPDDARDINKLSPREVEVLQCIANGMSNRQISEALSISDGTVKVHVKHVLKKLGFSTRVEAALWASENGYRGPSREAAVAAG